jgi:hypothetical protein
MEDYGGLWRIMGIIKLSPIPKAFGIGGRLGRNTLLNSVFNSYYSVVKKDYGGLFSIC